MAASSSSAPVSRQEEFVLERVATFPNLRALAWDGNILYASRGYELLRAEIASQGGVTPISGWQLVARHRPAWWRALSASTPLSFRLCRDGFHALAVLSSGHLVGAVPGAIVSAGPGEKVFRVTHLITRGTRPLHIAATPTGQLFFGEYFDNAQREEVHIYTSTDQGNIWHVAYTFPPKSIRHVHNIVYDRWENCLWILTGDYGDECRILRASCDFSTVDTVLTSNQQARAVAFVPAANALYFASDTPLEKNFIYRLDRNGDMKQAASIASSSICGCEAGGAIFFSTMIEPSIANPDRHVRVYGSAGGESWRPLLEWKKDAWPMKYFQYGNVFFPDGLNSGKCLALSTVATESGDLETSLWKISPP